MILTPTILGFLTQIAAGVKGEREEREKRERREREEREKREKREKACKQGKSFVNQMQAWVAIPVACFSSSKVKVGLFS